MGLSANGIKLSQKAPIPSTIANRPLEIVLQEV
jgi:hypothetical protein